MPYYRPALRAADQKYTITWRAWALKAWFGEMQVVDWLTPGCKPEEPLPWSAWISFNNSLPCLNLSRWRSEGTVGLLWPDGEIDFFPGWQPGDLTQLYGGITSP